MAKWDAAAHASRALFTSFPWLQRVLEFAEIADSVAHGELAGFSARVL
jgi:hypothetical protein